MSLRELRLNRGLSLQAASEEIGVSRDTLERAERGATRPHPRNALKIASFFGHQVTDLWPVPADDESEDDVPGELVA